MSGSRPAMPIDAISLKEWIASVLNHSNQDIKLELIGGDASPRRYFRVHSISKDGFPIEHSLIGVLSPATEKNTEFLHIRNLLSSHGIRVPAAHAADLKMGYLLLEDFGDTLLADKLLSRDAVNPYYSSFSMLLQFANIDTDRLALPFYNRTLLQEELDLFVDWFMKGLLDKPMADTEIKMFSSLSEFLIEEALSQPNILTHRDFHSRNLMYLPSGDLGVIDFQDAVIGPLTYDPVSLLKDCYTNWRREEQLDWLSLYLTRLRQYDGFCELEMEDIVRWFDLMGLQRHLKVLGIFSRLCLRDGKPSYLHNLPKVIHYILETLGIYAGTESTINCFSQWFNRRVLTELPDQTWWLTNEEANA